MSSLYLKLSNDWYYNDVRVIGEAWTISDYAFSSRDYRCIRVSGEPVTGLSIKEFISESDITHAILSARPITEYYARAGIRY